MENKDLKLELEEKEKLLALFQKDDKPKDFETKRVLLLKSHIIKLEKYIKHLTNTIKASNIFTTDLEYAIEQSLNLLGNLEKNDNLEEIHNKISLKIGDFKNMQIKLKESFKQKNVNYEKFLNQTYLKTETVNKNWKQKSLLFNLEEEINQILRIIIKNNNNSNEDNPESIKLLEICRHCMSILLEVGLKIDLEKEDNILFQTKDLKDKQKMEEFSEKITKRLLKFEKPNFNLANSKILKNGDISKKFVDFFENFQNISEEMISDVDLIIEKYHHEGKYYNILNDFISKTYKIFNNNPELLLQFESIIVFFKNDLFILQKIAHIFECLLMRNALLLKELSFFVEERLMKIMEKINEDVYAPFKDMVQVFEEKKDMEIESYFIQITNLFHFQLLVLNHFLIQNQLIIQSISMPIQY